MTQALEEAIEGWLNLNASGEIHVPDSLDILEVSRANFRYHRALQRYIATPTGIQQVKVLLREFMTQDEVDGKGKISIAERNRTTEDKKSDR